MEYDVVIVGASFAGLAVASRLQGNVLVVDKNGVGSERTSACATAVSVLEALGCEGSLQCVIHDAYVHLRGGRVRFVLPEPYCTFDYGAFCQSLLARSGAEFLRARVVGAGPGLVHTDQGEVRGRILVDASGWRAVVARHWEGPWAQCGSLSLGVETDVPVVEQGLNFWADASLVRRGYAWLFPAARSSGVGLASYEGSRGVGRGLSAFLARRGLEPAGRRGGFFPSRLRRGLAGEVFVVGDAAGHCLPLTGEGIRPAVYFGLRCGELIQGVLGGALRLEEALQRYGALVEKHRWVYRLLEGVQRCVPSLPPRWLAALVRLGGFPPVARLGLLAYLYVASPRRLV